MEEGRNWGRAQIGEGKKEKVRGRNWEGRGGRRGRIREERERKGEEGEKEKKREKMKGKIGEH